MWTCPKCSARNWDDASVCHACGRSPAGNIVLSAYNSGGNRNYTVTIAPGVVRYFGLDTVVADSVEDLIEGLRKLSAQPQIKAPQAAFDADTVFPNKPWDERLRAHHQYFRLLRDRKAPSCVYQCFHAELRLTNLEFDECMNSWVREAWGSGDVTESFARSSDHLISDSLLGPCVFLKAPFVRNRLSLLAEEAKREAENRRQSIEAELEGKRQEEAARKASEDLERLRRTKFGTFIYVMEDLRTGRFKIGRSMTPNKRERTLQAEVPEVVLRLSVPADEGHENELHCHFASKRIRGEWFELGPDDLIWITEYLKRNGDVERASVDYQWLGTMLFRSAVPHPA